MRALILNGLEKNTGDPGQVCSVLTDELSGSGWETRTLPLHEMKIAYCLGCFQCWTKTPGECRHNDDGRNVARQFIASDLVILLTPVTFGGYSSNLKKAMDRIICLISPFFTKVNGETHHKKRYDKSPDIAGIGILDQPDAESERIFKTLVERNAINFRTTSHNAGVVISSQGPDKIRTDIKNLLGGFGVAQ